MPTISSKATLNNGVEMPYFGLGTYKSAAGDETYNSVRWALEFGYRHIDTAQHYGNEESVGKAINDGTVPREEIFVTTKIAIDNFGYTRTKSSFEESLRKMSFDYVDLLLLHFPIERLRLESWKALEEIYSAGKAKSIGISNFNIEHIEELLQNCEVVPAVNQVEFSPFLYQKELLAFCNSKNILLESYTPLTRGSKFNHPLIVELSKKYKKSPAQILIRWFIEHEIVVIPKSSKRERILENSQVFDFQIEPVDMEKMDSLNEDLHLAWNPNDRKQVKFFSNQVVRKLASVVKKFR